MTEIKGFTDELASLGLPEKYESLVGEVTTRFSYLIYHIPRGIPEYTDHGLEHSIRVLKILSKILKEYPVAFDDDEKLVLALAAPLHDLGCLIKRENHHVLSVELLKRTEFKVIFETIEAQLIRFLNYVIISHSSKYSFDQVPDDKRLQVLCALFRLADACDISASRVKETMFNILKDFGVLDKSNILFWESHLAIESIEISNTCIIPWIYNIKRAESALKHLQDEIDEINRILVRHRLPIFSFNPKEVKIEITDDNSP